MSKKAQIALITGACLATYAGLRMLPVEACEFLHYGDYVNSEGVIEGCGYEETTFFDMSQFRYPITVDLRPLADPVAGEPVQFDMLLRTTTGKPIEWEDIAITHTERIHAMVVDTSLEDYQHIHPQPAGPPGHYRMELTPRRTGPYSVYLDFIPLVNSKRTLLGTTFSVDGPGKEPFEAEQLVHNTPSFRFSLSPDRPGLPTGEVLTFNIQVTARDQAPLRFTPVMDAYAHVVAFDAEGTGFAHLHPLNPLVDGQDPAHPDLRFSVEFDTPGYYRIWAQMIINGQHLFVPFGLLVGQS